MEKIEKVSIIGLGYIGLPTAAVLASRGVEVVGVDIDENVVNTVNKGDVHIVESDLQAVVYKAVQDRKLRATLTPEPADAFIVAVPTPFKDDHVPDLRYVKEGVQSLSHVLKKGDLVILESTSPVGTAGKISEWLGEFRSDLRFPHQVGEEADVQIAYCPERVLPGKILKELVENDRVIGGMTPRCAARAMSLYKIFVEGQCFTTDSRTAELVKLTENAYRDVNIAFANELSIICDKFDINVWELIGLANRHPRVKILQPGPGVGGHCIAVDPWFIVHSAPEQSRLIRVAREVNDSKPEVVLEKVRRAVENAGKPANVVCLGLAYKQDTDDLRESPAMEIVERLAAERTGIARLSVVEPHIKELPAQLKKWDVQLAKVPAALRSADVILLLVGHREFREIDRKLLGGKAVVDTRGIWSTVKDSE